MADEFSASRRATRLRVTLLGDGSPGPIEARIGRRLIRLVDPGSEEGVWLLGSRRVELVGPGGEQFGRVRLKEAWRRLSKRLERRLAAKGSID